MSTHRTRVKVCGITSYDDAMYAVDAGADAIGFIFVEGTPRYIEPEKAAGIMFSLPPFVSTVGVVRDLDVDAFCDLEQMCPAHSMQLHGKEPVDVVKQCGPGVIKAFKYEDATINSQLTRWGKVDEVDALLIDGSDGGEGKAFDWSSLKAHIDGFNKPIIIAGGIDADNVTQLIQTLHPYGVDVSSGVEDEPGKKNAEKIAKLCAAVRAADHA
jgi:phosphoribosylanthranilate isomerase